MVSPQPQTESSAGDISSSLPAAAQIDSLMVQGHGDPRVRESRASNLQGVIGFSLPNPGPPDARGKSTVGAPVASRMTVLPPPVMPTISNCQLASLCRGATQYLACRLLRDLRNIRIEPI